MTITHPAQTNFQLGEVSSEVDARLDFDRHSQAFVLGENIVLRPQGGWMRTPGTRYIAAAKYADRTTVVRPFVSGVTDAYMLEMGDEYMRFFKQQAPLLAPTVTAAILNGTFDADISNWTDASTGAGASAWDSTETALKLTGNGTDEGGARQAVAITETSTVHVLLFEVRKYAYDTVRVQIGTTTTGAEVLPSFTARAGWHMIPFTPGAATVHLQFYASTPSSAWVDNVQILSGVPLELPTPYAQTGVRGLQHAHANDVRYVFCGMRPTCKLERRADNRWSLVQTPYQDGPYLSKNTTATTATPSATSGYITLTFSSVTGINDNSGFTSADLGRLVRWQNSGASADIGWGFIKEITSSTVVKVQLEVDLNNTVASKNWWLGRYSVGLGYPTAGVFHQQRLYLGYNNVLSASQTADLENMRPDSWVSSQLTVEADDAFDYTLAALEDASILWLMPRKDLLVGTLSGEGNIASDGPAVTAEDITVDFPRTTYGTAFDIPPLRIGGVVVFVQKARTKLLEYNFDFSDENYRGLDLTALTPKLFHNTPASTALAPLELTWAQEPHGLILVPRTDGQLAVLTYLPLHGIAGWTRWTTDGSYKSVAAVPGVSGGGQVYSSLQRDEIWVVVEREIDGNTVQYIEMFEGDYHGPDRAQYTSGWRAAQLAAQVDAFYVHSGVTKQGSFTVVDGLDHLEGETVVALADGGVETGLVVSGGQVTLSATTSIAHVGLPYTHRWRSVRLNIGTRSGSALLTKQHTARAAVVLQDTGPYSIGIDPLYLETVDLREYDTVDTYDSPPPLLSGDYTEDLRGDWTDIDGPIRLYIESSAPTPMQLLAISPAVNIGAPPK